MTTQAPNQITDPDVYKTLLESTKAIPWKIDWATMQFAYIGPQIEKLLGWNTDSWVSAEDWIARMHPDDRAVVPNYCIAQSKAGHDHEADYRALTKSGGYIWIRDVVHVVRDAEGEVTALIGFMFDISERKKTEEEVLRLQKELEHLSYKDGLTDLPNRRMFDSVIELEWLNAKRYRHPLSLILMDIDFFKQYNDHYGHLQGDACLKQVAQVLGQAVTRSRDLIARFGGEEFVIVLPETDAVAARTIAERCQHLIQQANIPHQQSQVANILTISLGVNTIIPSQKDDLFAFIEKTDQQLYQAKQNGRNLII
ncbi:MAG: sensor domain-containing diguanylate cyclase [Methylophilus sp.]|nr:sensor domain-containing diguanylate cyclase [Methylophilus sp.]MDP3609605.1 sensor domain-containing diguanylate cyclase [Methylophilus sp.]